MDFTVKFKDTGDIKVITADTFTSAGKDKYIFYNYGWFGRVKAVALLSDVYSIETDVVNA